MDDDAVFEIINVEYRDGQARYALFRFGWSATVFDLQIPLGADRPTLEDQLAVAGEQAAVFLRACAEKADQFAETTRSRRRDG